MSKKFQKIVVIIMLLALIASAVAGIVVYLI